MMHLVQRKDNRLQARIQEEISPARLRHARRLIIASNRGPVEYQLTQKGTLKARRGSGGMVTALLGAGNHMEVTWVAMTMTEGDRQAVKEAQMNGGLLASPIRGQNMDLRYVAIPKTAYRKYYDKISNDMLWFLQHYMYDPIRDQRVIGKLQDAWFNGYCVANQAIADAVNKEIERSNQPAVVMVQDYHLYLAPAMIRRQHPEATIQQFIHIPWPDSRCWFFLPANLFQAIFSGLVGNDIIGFQTPRDAHNFLEGAQAILEDAKVDFEEGTIEWRGHVTRVNSYPVSISVEDEKRLVRGSAARRAFEKISPLFEEHTIIRVDRVEPTKNILRGFQAYDRVLEDHPELHGKVTFLAFLVPSRQTLPMYRRTGAEVRAIIEEINKKYGTAEWTPIHPFFGNDRARALAAMQYYDVLLVNPIIDGMNLVAKEGPVVNKCDGVLVLSRTAGAHQQLAKGSIPISPIDVLETAQAIYKALVMTPEERKIKIELAREAVVRSDLTLWISRQVEDINEVMAPRERETEPLPVLSDKLIVPLAEKPVAVS